MKERFNQHGVHSVQGGHNGCSFAKIRKKVIRQFLRKLHLSAENGHFRHKNGRHFHQNDSSTTKFDGHQYTIIYHAHTKLDGYCRYDNEYPPDIRPPHLLTSSWSKLNQFNPLITIKHPQIWKDMTSIPSWPHSHIVQLPRGSTLQKYPPSWLWLILLGEGP